MDIESQPAVKEAERLPSSANASPSKSPPKVAAGDTEKKTSTEKPNNAAKHNTTSHASSEKPSTADNAKDSPSPVEVARNTAKSKIDESDCLIVTASEVAVKESSNSAGIEKMETENSVEKVGSQAASKDVGQDVEMEEEQPKRTDDEDRKVVPLDEGEDSQKEDTSTVGEDSQSPSTQSQTPPQSANADLTTSPSTGNGSKLVAASGIPDNILSPPKSETLTDDANTATSSSSPASDSQLSPATAKTTDAQAPSVSPKAPTPESGSNEKKKAQQVGGSSSGGTRVVQPINVVANGTIPVSSGKPHMATMNKKLNKPATRTTRPRKQKATVAMYESEISDNKTGIKLCIKKSDSSSALTASGAISPPVAATAASNKLTTATASASAAKQPRKRSRKSKTRPRVDSDDSEYETKRKKERAPNNNAERQKKVSFSGSTAGGEEQERPHVEQGDWGANVPKEILCQIFQFVVDKEGCLPTLLRLGRVCSLWRNVSLSPRLWKTMDLSTWIKEKYRTEQKLKWFVENRCSACTELNVANWKVADINCFLTKLTSGCPNLVGITLSGWKGFTSDHLTNLVDNMKKLARLDLSSVNVEMNASKSAVGLQSLCNALQTMNGRLTHLYLAHNRLAGIPQIVTILAAHCPNLLLLDLSNVTTQATSHGVLHIEKLQHGCTKLKVLRVTNSHVVPGPATMQEMMDSPGFPDLEELSVAAVTDESRIICDEHLQRILKTSSKLKLLDVRGCTRLTHESLIRLPAWDIKHLFLSGCSVTRDVGSGLELIASKWAHSLIELDLAWANVQKPLDNALRSLAEKGAESPLAHLNLCGSSVSDEAVKEILANCAHMSSINLSSCRGLPRGVKHLVQGPQELQELRDVLKVQMKVKLPSQLKQEREASEAAAKVNSGSGEGASGSGGGGGGDGGNGSGSSSQSN